jgi:ribose transport system substrate-binding protein
VLGASGSTASAGTARAAAAAIPPIVDLPCSKNQGLKGKVVGLNWEESEAVLNQMQADIEQFAKLSNCGLKFKVTNAGGDPAQQVTDAEQLVTDGVNLLFTNPAEAPGWTAVGPLVKSHHTLWMNWSSVPEPDATVNATVWQAASGALVAAPVATWLKKNFGGAGQVAVLTSLTDPGFQARTNAFKQSLLKLDPKAQFVGTGNGGFTSPTVAEQSTLNLIQAHPQLKVIFADWDGAAIGAVTAAREAGKTDPTKFYIAGQDGSAAQLEDMQKPGNVLQSSGTLLFRYDAGIVVRDMELMLMGKKTLGLTRVLIPKLVTTSNVKSFLATLNQPFNPANNAVFSQITKYFPFTFSNVNQLPTPKGKVVPTKIND